MERLWMPSSMPEHGKETICRAEGVKLYDTEGNCYLDGNSGLWNMPLGYSNQRIKDAVREQLEAVPYVNPEAFSNDRAEELAELITSILPKKYEKVMFTCTGSEGIELAIKLVRKYQSLMSARKRKQIAIMNLSYHGSYYGSMSASDFESKWRNGYGPMLPGFVELGVPYDRRYRYTEPDENLEVIHGIKDKMLARLEMMKEELAAILIEPVLGSAGVIPIHPILMESLLSFAKENKILTIFDEVATGFGRTGTMFRFQEIGYEPDLIVMSKAINNGYFPFGAVAISQKIVDVFRKKKQFIFHLSTQNTNPACCASSIETIKQMTEHNGQLLTEAVEKGSYFKDKLLALKEKRTLIYDIRSAGMMFAVELSEQGTIRPDKLERILEELKKNGVLSTASYTEQLVSCLVFFLPYVISHIEMDTIIEKLDDTLGMME